jgi:hypothetical protein
MANLFHTMCKNSKKIRASKFCNENFDYSGGIGQRCKKGFLAVLSAPNFWGTYMGIWRKKVS